MDNLRGAVLVAFDVQLVLVLERDQVVLRPWMCVSVASYDKYVLTVVVNKCKEGDFKLGTCSNEACRHILHLIPLRDDYEIGTL